MNSVSEGSNNISPLKILLKLIPIPNISNKRDYIILDNIKQINNYNSKKISENIIKAIPSIYKICTTHSIRSHQNNRCIKNYTKKGNLFRLKVVIKLKTYKEIINPHQKYNHQSKYFSKVTIITLIRNKQLIETNQSLVALLRLVIAN